MQRDEDFLAVDDHFERLVARLPSDQLQLYNSMRHVRVETGFCNRRFTVYRVEAHGPRVLDTIEIIRFIATDREGKMMTLRSDSISQELAVGYEPVQLFSFPVFLWLPLHGKLRWGASRLDKGSLAFPVIIRTMSRKHLRERGVVFCETNVAYAKEFLGTSAA